MSGRAPGRWRRLSQAASTVLGGALAWATVGALASLLMPLGHPWPEAPLAVRWVVQVALGFGLAWWLGLLWTALLVARSEPGRWRPGWRVGAPWLAAAAAMAVAWTGRAMGLQWRASLLLGFVLACVLPSVSRHAGKAARCP